MTVKELIESCLSLVWAGGNSEIFIITSNGSYKYLTPQAIKYFGDKKVHRWSVKKNLVIIIK